MHSSRAGSAAYPLRPEAAAASSGSRGAGGRDGHTLHALCGDSSLAAAGDALGPAHGLQGELAS